MLNIQECTYRVYYIEFNVVYCRTSVYKFATMTKGFILNKNYERCKLNRRIKKNIIDWAMWNSELKLRNGAYDMYTVQLSLSLSFLSNVRAFYRLPFNYAICCFFKLASVVFNYNIECETVRGNWLSADDNAVVAVTADYYSLPPSLALSTSPLYLSLSLYVSVYLFHLNVTYKSSHF